MILGLARTLVLAFALACSPARATEPCVARLERPALTEAEYDRRETRARPFKEFSTAAVTKFQQTGLPELHRLATEAEVTIGELVKDLHASQTLLVEHYKIMNARQRIALMGNFEKNYEGVEALIDKKKLKLKDYVRLKSLMLLLYMSGQVAAITQLSEGESTRIDPFGTFDEYYVNEVLAAAEDGILDQLIAFMAENPLAPKPSTVIKPTPPVDAPTAPLPPPPSEIKPPAEIVPGVEAHPPSAPELDLAKSLRMNARLSSDFVYQAQPRRGPTLNVRLHPNLVKQAEGNQEATVRRLLKAVIVGQNHAGIKMMPDIGPGIIEVKAILHGHKRILGCLDGQDLELVKMIDIKERRATYFARIDKDMCGPRP